MKGELIAYIEWIYNGLVIRELCDAHVKPYLMPGDGYRLPQVHHGISLASNALRETYVDHV